MSDIYSVIALSPLSASSGPAVTLDVLTDQVRAPFLSGLMEAPSLNAVSSHIGWFNVKDDFGAVGDGTRDDTESIQNAIAAAYADIVAGIYRGGVILFPPGAYVVTDTLVVGASGAGGLIFLGAGSQATAYSDAGSCILNNVTSGSLFEINVTGPEGGVVFRDLQIVNFNVTEATFDWQSCTNGIVERVSTSADFDVFQFSQPGTSAVSNIEIRHCNFDRIKSRLFNFIGGASGVHFHDNYIGGDPNIHMCADSENYVGAFSFTAADICSEISFEDNDVEGMAGGWSFVNAEGTLSQFSIRRNVFDIGKYAKIPAFQAIASGSAVVQDGFITDNWIPIGGFFLSDMDAIHLDACGGGSSKVAGIYLAGNVAGAGGAGANTPGSYVYIANGASDITIVGGRANARQNVVYITGFAGTTDGITIVGLGANTPTNGYGSDTNAVGVYVSPGSISSPLEPTVSELMAGGTLEPGTYRVAITYEGLGGSETLASPDIMIAVGEGQEFSVISPEPLTGVIGYNVYLSTPGGGTGTETKQNMTFIPLGTDFLVSALSAGAGRPAETTAFMTVTNLTVSGCNLTECSSNGVVVEAALPAVAERLSIIGNSLWGYDGPGTAISLSGTGISNAYVADNPGYNPVGAGSSPPAIAAGATRNPYQQPARVFISATGGAAVPTGITLSPNGVLVELGVGESIDLVGSITGLSWTWFAE